MNPQPPLPADTVDDRAEFTTDPAPGTATAVIPSPSDHTTVIPGGSSPASATTARPRAAWRHFRHSRTPYFRRVAFSAGGVTVAIMLAVGLFLALRAGQAILPPDGAGLSFLTTQAWSPETGDFGIAAVLFGTITIAIIAMSVSVPLALGTSLLISEVLRGRLKQWAITLVDLMAAVPSVVYGLWGVFFLQEAIIPSLAGSPRISRGSRSSPSPTRTARH